MDKYTKNTVQTHPCRRVGPRLFLSARFFIFALCVLKQTISDMVKNGWAGGKAYESPVAEAIELEPFDVILYGTGNGNEDIDPGEDLDW